MILLSIPQRWSSWFDNFLTIDIIYCFQNGDNPVCFKVKILHIKHVLYYSADDNRNL